MKDYFNYTGKTCVVVGGSNGMGASCVDILLDLGARVIVMDWAEPQNKQVEYLHVNLLEKDSIDQAFAKLPKFEKYFHFAGVAGLKEGYLKTMTINFLSLKYITETYLFDLVLDGGAIAYVASMGANGWREYREEYVPLLTLKGWDACWEWVKDRDPHRDDCPIGGSIGYSLSKRCMVYYTKMMACAFVGRHIRVNVVLPSNTKTQLTTDFNQIAGGEKAMMTFMAVDRIAQPREIAEPMVWVNSDMASYISGDNINVDFGHYAGVFTNTLPEGKRPVFPHPLWTGPDAWAAKKYESYVIK